MHYLFGFLCVCALGVMPLVGCGETTGDGGSGGSAGSGGMAGTGGTAGSGGSGGDIADGFPCTEQGIRDAIAEGDGPHTFDCDGPTTIVTQAEIVIDNDVILNGSDNLRVDGNKSHPVFSVSEHVVAELRGFRVTGGSTEVLGGGIANYGTLTVSKTTVSGNFANSGGGIFNDTNARLTLKDSTISGNTASFAGGGIFSNGTLTVTNSTISGNSADFSGALVINSGSASLTHTTIARNETVVALSGDLTVGPAVTVTNSLIEGDCVPDPVTSAGHNIESPDDTCGLLTYRDDQVAVSAAQLNLGPLDNNGGSTLTHALGASSAAIDAIVDLGDCLEATDQRGVERPQGFGCDVGAFELQEGGQ